MKLSIVLLFLQKNCLTLYILYGIIYTTYTSKENNLVRVWSNGRIPPCQGEGTGSIPVTRSFLSMLYMCVFFDSF
jgi:hypothetical protein